MCWEEKFAEQLSIETELTLSESWSYVLDLKALGYLELAKSIYDKDGYRGFIPFIFLIKNCPMKGIQNRV